MNRESETKQIMEDIEKAFNGNILYRIIMYQLLPTLTNKPPPTNPDQHTLPNTHPTPVSLCTNYYQH